MLQASFMGSYVQQSIPRLHARNIEEANMFLKQLKYLDATIQFRVMTIELR